MYNISKLSEMSRTFVSTLRVGPCTNLAVAKAVANHLALPSGPVEDPEFHYREVHYGTARQLVSDLNEVTVINARDVLELVQSFWKARYGIAYPARVQPLNQTETCYAFFGYGIFVSEGVKCEIEKGGNQLIKQLNGFTAVLLDLTATPETAAQEVALAVSAPV